MDVDIASSAIVIFITFFFGIGIYMTVRVMLDARKAHATGARGVSLRDRVKARVGPVTPEKAPLNRTLRVLVEFVCSLFGFPGLGWSLSTRFAPGVVMMLIGPIFCWMVYPIILHHAGILAADPYAILKELPFIAAASAGTLAVLEIKAARRGYGRHAA